MPDRNRRLPGAPVQWRLVDRAALAAPAVRVAPTLLGKLLVRREDDAADAARWTAVRIVEVEAYEGGEDPASHAHRGRTARNATMFGPPGRLYVYFTYGMHHCANVVCGADGIGSAVLLRAGEPVAGIDHLWSRRAAARTERDLCSGPAKLCAALDIDRRLDGADLLDPGSAVLLVDDGTPAPRRPARTARVGITVGVEHRWRWHTRSQHVSRGRPATAASEAVR